MHKSSERHSSHFLAALGLGAALMYLLDPQQGRGRVTRARDRGARFVRRGRDAVGVGVRDLANRAGGAAARVRGLLRRGTPDDDVLLERVRALLGRCVSHPHAVEVTAVDGWVTLAGPVLAHEAACLVRAVRGVRGVRHIKDELVLHDATAADLPMALQGRRARPRSDFAPAPLPPGPRLALLGAGALLALAGVRRGGIRGALLGLAGAALSARAAADRRARGLPSHGAAPHADVRAADFVETGREPMATDAGDPAMPAWDRTTAGGRPLASASR